MIHSEFTYLELGRQFESAPTPERSQDVLTEIRAKIDAERADERSDAYYLIERGRKEIRRERR